MARNRQVQFLLAIELALVVCPITLGAVIFQDKAQKVWNDDGLPIVFIACAFITAIYWFCSYSLATRRELSIIAKRFTPTERTRVGMKEDPPIIVAMFFGLSFGLSIAFVWNPMVFITFVIFLQMLDLAGVSYINHKIADLVKEAIWSDNARDDCLKCIYQYYIVQPQVLRCTMLLLCYVGCLAILLTWDNQLNLPVAYSVFIVTFVIGQLTINHWRKQLAQVTM